jgi:hypothetical protein
MSRLIVGISSAIALSLISGAAEFAMGRDLYTAIRNAAPTDQPQIDQPLSFSSISLAAGTIAVNRGAKSDRTTGPAGSPAQMRTVSLQLHGFSDTTFLVRVPVAEGSAPAARSSAKPVTRKPMMACEAVVSVLTEVAKQLQPGSCVT